MIAILVVALVVVVLVGLAALFPLLDRACLAAAERRAGEALAGTFGQPPVVRIAERPFLTQAWRGVYRDVRITGGGLRLGEMTGASLDGQLRNAHLPLRDLRRRQVRELPCEHVHGRVVLPYGELARTARIPGLELRFRAGKVIATAALPVPGLNQIARVSGDAVLTIDGTNRVWLRVRHVTVAGFTLPVLALDQLLPALNVPIALPELPYGLRIDELDPTPDGLGVRLSADAVVFRKLG